MPTPVSAGPGRPCPHVEARPAGCLPQPLSPTIIITITYIMQ